MKYNQEAIERLDSESTDYSQLMIPGLSALIADPAGKRVIDIGCGGGRFARYFARLGALVTGVDTNEAQLTCAIANERKAPLGIEYRADFPIDSKGFDLALLMFVVLDCNSPNAVESLFDIAFKALRPGGVLVVGDLHPHNIARPNSLEDAAFLGDETYFENGARFRSRSQWTPGKFALFQPNFHYRFDFLLNSLLDKGFRLQRLIEPQHNTAFPTHVLICCEKPVGRTSSASEGDHLEG